MLTPAAAKLRDGEGEDLSTGVALRMRVTAIGGRLAWSGSSFAAYAMFNGEDEQKRSRQVWFL